MSIPHDIANIRFRSYYCIVFNYSFIYLLTLQPFYTYTNRNETHSFGCQIRFLTEGGQFCLFSRCFTGYLSESHPYIEENLQYNEFRDNFRLEMR